MLERSGRRLILEALQPARPRISYEEFRRRVPKYEGPPASIEEMNAAVDRMFASVIGSDRAQHQRSSPTLDPYRMIRCSCALRRDLIFAGPRPADGDHGMRVGAAKASRNIRKDQIAAAIDALTDLGLIVFEQVDGVRWALERLTAGADFADMIHVVQSRLAGRGSLRRSTRASFTRRGNRRSPVEALA
ncbi:hypothetical protein AB5I41_19950 [Sphingomonas sp. MMS24-JH45]